MVDGPEDTTDADRTFALFLTLGSSRSYGGSLGRKERSVRKRASRDGRLGVVGE
jgi:hypothetical protein